MLRIVCLFICLGPLMSGAAVPADIAQDVQQGQILQSEGRPLEAEKYFDSALKKAGKLSAPPETVVSVLSDLARLEMDLAHFETAAGLCQRALGVLAENKSTDSTTAEVLRLQLAELYIESGQIATGEQIVDLVIAREHSRLSQVSVNAALARDIRACLYAHRKKFARAEKIEREALTILEQLPEPANAESAIATLHLASFINIQRRPKEALPYLQRSLEMLQRLAVREAAMEGAAEITLASVYSQIGRVDEARKTAEDALRIIESHYGAAHPKTGTMLLAEAAILRKIGQEAEANQSQHRGEKILAAARNNGVASTVPAQAFLPW